MRNAVVAACLAGSILSILALYPQWNLMQLRGSEYEGSFATCDLDEMAYASYLQALIDGRPRKNDPYTGRDGAPAEPLAESLFSVQFVTAYMAAIPARAVGLSAVQMMPVISVFSAFLSAITLFWLLILVTRDAWTAIAGTLIVLTGAALISGIGAINGLFEGGLAYPFFPYLRRHIPSMSFPFLFMFLAALWCGQKAEDTRRRTAFAGLAVLCFAVLVFSYFYLWTAAAAILAGLFLFTILLRPDGWKPAAVYAASVGVACIVPLIPYAILLGSRNETMDRSHLLVYTRQPDLFRNVEIIGAAVIVVIAVMAWRKFAGFTRSEAVFVLSLALSPILAFNQQIVTGRSLQPFHYEYYTINYVVLLALVLTIAAVLRRFVSEGLLLRRTLWITLAAAAAMWGLYEAVETTRFWDDANIARDEAMPVNRRLADAARGRINDAKHETTLNLDALQANSQPTVAPQAVLWARHQHVFAGIRSWEENTDRYLKLLYYSDLDGTWLRKALTGCTNIEACMALFGWDRFNATLSSEARPLTEGEIDNVVEDYEEMIRSIQSEAAYEPMLDAVVLREDSVGELVNLSKWYELGPVDRFGSFSMRKLRPRFAE
jgi:hypothetical protein